MKYFARNKQIFAVIIGVLGCLFVYFGININQEFRHDIRIPNQAKYDITNLATINETVPSPGTSRFYEATLFFYVDTTIQRGSTPLFTIDTDQQSIPIKLSGSGWFQIGNTSSRALQQHPIPPGKHLIKITLSPIAGVQVICDAIPVLASGSIIEIYEGIQANSISFNPGNSSMILNYWGDLAVLDNAKTKSLNDITITGLLFLCISIYLLIVFRLKNCFEPIQNPQSRIMFRTIAILTVSGYVFATLLSVFGLTNLSFGTPSVKRSDWFDTLSLAEIGNPYIYSSAAYPPTTYLFLGLIPTNFAPLALGILVAVSVGVLTALFSSVTRTSEKYSGWIPGIILSLGFPTFFAVDRGNLDLFVITLLLAALLLGINGHNLFSNILSGLTIGLKIFTIPFIFLLQRSYKKQNLIDLVLPILFAGLITVGSLVIYGMPLSSSIKALFASSNLSQIPWQGIVENGLSLRQGFVASFGLIDNDETVFGSIYLANKHSLSIFYSLIGISSIIITTVYSFLSKGPIWLRALLLTVVCLLFSPLTFVYRGMLLLIPLALVFLENSKPNYYRLIALLIGLYFIPANALLTIFKNGEKIATVFYVFLELAIVVVVLFSIKKSNLKTLVEVSTTNTKRLLKFSRN